MSAGGRRMDHRPPVSIPVEYRGSSPLGGAWCRNCGDGMIPTDTHYVNVAGWSCRITLCAPCGRAFTSDVTPFGWEPTP